jgi:hypothetical protein
MLYDGEFGSGDVMNSWADGGFECIIVLTFIAIIIQLPLLSGAHCRQRNTKKYLNTDSVDRL